MSFMVVLACYGVSGPNVLKAQQKQSIVVLHVSLRREMKIFKYQGEFPQKKFICSLTYPVRRLDVPAFCGNCF